MTIIHIPIIQLSVPVRMMFMKVYDHFVLQNKMHTCQQSIVTSLVFFVAIDHLREYHDFASIYIKASLVQIYSIVSSNYVRH